MNTFFLENVLQKLSRRAERLRQIRWDFFQAALRAYFELIENNPSLSDVLTQLKNNNEVKTTNEWITHYNETRMPFLPRSLEGQVAQCLSILETAKDGTEQAFTVFVQWVSDPNLNNQKQIFVENFFDPLHSYLEEVIERANFNEFVLMRYKRWCEWYRQDELKDKLKVEWKKQKSGQKALKEFEKILTSDATSFIFQNGLTPISLTLGNMKPDITSDIFSINPLVVEVKIFGDKKDFANLQQGVRQINQALSTTHLDRGFLIIFNIGELSINVINDIGDRSFTVIVVNITSLPPSKLKDHVEIKAGELLNRNN